jgi:hypothetical protein
MSQGRRWRTVANDYYGLMTWKRRGESISLVLDRWWPAEGVDGLDIFKPSGDEEAKCARHAIDQVASGDRCK